MFHYHFFSYSKTCYAMKIVTQPRSGFIVVECSRKKSNQVFYKGFHLVAMFSNNFQNHRNHAILQKIDYWQKWHGEFSKNDSSKYKNEGGPPPSVLLIGIDSTSRLNFHRFMSKTASILHNDLGAIEMKGYTKGST